MLCPICSTELVPGNRFCGECGATLGRVAQQVAASAPPFEVWQGAVLCASVEGYIRLCEFLPLSEVGAIVNEYLGRLLPVIQSGGGQLNWYSAEKIVAYFGLSEVNDPHNPAVRAVHTALMLHQCFAEFGLELLNGYAADVELELRVGIASGALLRGPLGEASAQHPAWARTSPEDNARPYGRRRIVVGDVVNRAVQLEYEARPGHILTDQATVEQAAPHFAFQSLGNHTLRRRTAPVEVFSVVGPQTHRT